METMTFTRQAGAAVFLVTLTLSMQCAGIALLISWARASIERRIARLSSLNAAVLMIRFSTLVIVLRFLQISVWAVFYRWYCFSVVGVLVLLLCHQLLHRRLWGCRLTRSFPSTRAGRECHRRVDVWHLCKWPRCIGDQVSRT